jgi:hypothetical protein
MPQVRFEPMIPVFELALDRASSVIGACTSAPADVRFMFHLTKPAATRNTQH